MANNYGYVVSYNYKGLKGRQKGRHVMRTKSEANQYAKDLNKGFKSISGARAVKATKKQYQSHVEQTTRDIINSKK